jgi:hypothetical protein
MNDTQSGKYSSENKDKELLIETEKRVTEGKEKVIDWNEAKKLLRDEFK